MSEIFIRGKRLRQSVKAVCWIRERDLHFLFFRRQFKHPLLVRVRFLLMLSLEFFSVLFAPFSFNVVAAAESVPRILATGLTGEANTTCLSQLTITARQMLPYMLYAVQSMCTRRDAKSDLHEGTGFENSKWVSINDKSVNTS